MFIAWTGEVKVDTANSRAVAVDVSFLCKDFIVVPPIFCLDYT